MVGKRYKLDKRLNISRMAALPSLLACLFIGSAQVDAATALGRASATVLAPSVISVASVKIVVPTPNAVASYAGSIANAISVSAAAPSNADGVTTIAGVQISSVDGSNALSFNIAGVTTSSYVLHLAPTAGDTRGTNPSSGVSSLIVSMPPLPGNGRLAVVLSQMPSDLMPQAVGLTVNYN